MEDALSVDTMLLRARSGHGPGLAEGLVSRVSGRIVGMQLCLSCQTTDTDLLLEMMISVTKQHSPDILLTCVLRWADAVAVTFLVNRACNSGCGQPPVSAESVGGDRGVWAVQRPLASVAVASSWAGFGCATGCRV